MAKYDPLQAYLKRQRVHEIDLTFREIENLIVNILPNAARDPQWWAGGRDGERVTVQAQAWGRAGFSARLVAGAERVIFTRQG